MDAGSAAAGPGDHVDAGFLHRDYVAAHAEWGEPRRLEGSGGWLLLRPIPDSRLRDAMAGYRYLFCHDWSALADDLADIDDVVSVMAVTDPFGDFSETDLERAFPDQRRPYKSSFVVDLHDPSPSSHHLARARKGARKVSIDVSEADLGVADDLERLYRSLRPRHDLEGIQALSPTSIAGIVSTPGTVAIRGSVDGVCVSMSIYLIVGDVAYSHLVASDETGYRTAASYVVHAAAIEAFRGRGLAWLELGSGAGAEANPNDGLSNFKRGWSDVTRQTYLCGRVIDGHAYDRLVRRSESSDARYFPAYRAPVPPAVPRTSQATVYYDALAPTYSEELEWRDAYLRSIEDIVIERILQRGADRVVDVGCGDGQRLIRIQSATSAAAVGLDSSPGMLRAAIANGIDARLVDVSDEHLDVGTLPRGDVVIALWNVLGHVGGRKARLQALRHMRAMTADGGVVILDVNNRYNIAYYGWARVARNVVSDQLGRGDGGDFVTHRTDLRPPVSTVVHLFSEAEMTALLAEAGFGQIRIVYVDYDDGAVVDSRWRGQICVIAEPA